MTKNDGRKCSHCGRNGHNSRTCNNNVKEVKLFGVRIDEGGDNKMKMKVEDKLIRRSKSLGNLENVVNDLHNGDLSDGSRNRKEGKPWTEKEPYISFLSSLEKYRKQKEASALSEQLFESYKTKIQANRSVASTTYYGLPPLSPITRPLGLPSSRHMPCMMGSVSGDVQGFTAPGVEPSLAWIPGILPNPTAPVPSQNQQCIQNFKRATFEPFVARPSTGIISRPPAQVQSQKQQVIQLD